MEEKDIRDLTGATPEELACEIAKILDEIFDEQFSLIENEAKSAGRFTTTPEYDRKMQRLIKKVDRPLWAYTNTPLKRVACILAIIVFISVTSLTVHAIYKKFFEFKYSQNTQFTEIFTKDIDMATAPDTILTRYTIDVPQGYECTFEKHFEAGATKHISTRYTDNSGKFISSSIKISIFLSPDSVIFPFIHCEKLFSIFFL